MSLYVLPSSEPPASGLIPLDFAGVRNFAFVSIRGFWLIVSPLRSLTKFYEMHRESPPEFRAATPKLNFDLEQP